MPFKYDVTRIALSSLFSVPCLDPTGDAALRSDTTMLEVLRDQEVSEDAVLLLARRGGGGGG